MDSVYSMSMKKLTDNEIGECDSVCDIPPPTTITTTTTESGGDDSTNANRRNSDINSNPQSLPALVKSTERSCLNDENNISQYGGVDSQDMSYGVDNLTTMSSTEAGDFKDSGGGDGGSDGRGGGGDGGVCNLSFDPSPEKHDNLQIPKQQQQPTKTKTGMDDKESKRSFLYPSLGDSLKNGKTVDDPGYDVTEPNNVTEPEKCGIGGCYPDCLQRFRSIGCFSAVYGLTGIVTSALSVYITSQITTLEKHFNFNSSVSGFLMSCNDFGYFLTCLFLSYFTRRIHIPRCLAIATVLYGLSGLMCTIPYFGTKDLFQNTFLAPGNTSNVSTLSSTGQMCVLGSQASQSDSCHGNSKHSDAGGIHGVSDHWRTLAITFIGVGMLIQGVAKSPRVSFVSVYIDDNVTKTKSAFFLGIITGLAIFGPSVAFIMGGAFSSIYITLEDTGLTRQDPRWLGAWWIGFLMFGSISLVVGLPLLFFPKKIIRKPEIEMAEMKRRMQNHGQNKFLLEIKGFFTALLKLLKNPLYILLVLGSAITALSVSGLMPFQPKYLEEHFNIPAWRVNIVLGALTVGGASVGTILGGVLTSRFRLSPLTCLKIKIIVFSVALGLLAVSFFIICDQPVFHSGNNGSLGNSSTCSQSCQCSDTSYFPVCGDDGRNYFSPCHAGCTDTINGGMIFSNCSCLSSAKYSQARGGLCDSDCTTKFWVYTSFSFISSMSLTVTIMPSFVTTVRSVPEDQKPMALGISAFISTLLGWFPGPILFGMIVDSTCLITQSSPCGDGASKDGACLLYDLAAFRIKYHGAVISLRVVAIGFYACALLYVHLSSKNPFTSHDDEKNDDNKACDNTKDDKRKHSLPMSVTTTTEKPPKTDDKITT